MSDGRVFCDNGGVQLKGQCSLFEKSTLDAVFDADHDSIISFSKIQGGPN